MPPIPSVPSTTTAPKREAVVDATPQDVEGTEKTLVPSDPDRLEVKGNEVRARAEQWLNGTRRGLSATDAEALKLASEAKVGSVVGPGTLTVETKVEGGSSGSRRSAAINAALAIERARAGMKIAAGGDGDGASLDADVSADASGVKGGVKATGSTTLGPTGDVKLDGAGDVSVDGTGSIRGGAHVGVGTTVAGTVIDGGAGVTVANGGVSGDVTGRATFGPRGKSTTIDGGLKMDSGGVRADANVRWERGAGSGNAGVQATTERVAATGTFKPGGGATQIDGSIGIEQRSLDATLRLRGALGDAGGRIAFGRGRRDVAGDAATSLTLGSLQGRALVRGRAGRATEAKDVGANAADGRRIVELSCTTVSELGGGIGVVAGGAVLGAGADGRKTERVTWRVVCSADDAAALIADPAKAAMPSLLKPAAIAIGDVVTVETEGELSLFVEAGVLGATVAGRGTVAGELALSVERRDDNVVRLTVAPSSVRRASIDGKALVLTASISSAELNGLRHTFDLDLSTRAGREAYAAALCGRVPGPDEMPSSSVTLVDDVNASLPAGVRAVALSDEHVRTHTLSTSLAYLFVGMTLEYDKTSEQRRTAEQGRVTRRHGTSSGTTTKSLLSGTAQARVSGEVVTVEDASGTKLKGVSLIARFSDDWVRPRELARIVASLRDSTGQKLPEFSGVPGENREIELEVMADAPALEALVVDDVAILAACRAASLGDDEGNVLAAAMRKAKSASARADVLVDFVQLHGLRGVGAIARAWPAFPVALRGRTDAYARVLADAEAVANVFEGRPAPDAYLYYNRATQIAPVLQRLNEAIDALEIDPFFVDEGGKLFDRLCELCGALADLVDLRDVPTPLLDELFHEIQLGGLSHPGHAFGLVLAELQTRRP